MQFINIVQVEILFLSKIGITLQIIKTPLPQ